MLVIRCTQKVLRRVDPEALHKPKRPTTPKRPTVPTAPAASTTRLGDWFANTVSVGRQRFILFVAERTRLPILVPAREVKRLGEHLAGALPPVLQALGVPGPAIQRELDDMREWVVAPTNSRSVLGSLNEFALGARHYLGSKPDADLQAVSLWLSEMPILSLNDSADSMTRAVLAEPEGAAPPPRVRPAAAASVRGFRLKVTLIDSRPPIWRRFEVPADISLERLHHVLQAVMGWTNSHLHEFEKGGVAYGVSDREFGVERVSERKTRLEDLIRQPGDYLDYQYDFGDSWHHRVVLESIDQVDGRTARVLEGKRACPPEDAGGIWGYESLLEALANPKHEEHEAMREWAGADFDAAAFDIDEANRRLRRVKVG